MSIPANAALMDHRTINGTAVALYAHAALVTGRGMEKYRRQTCFTMVSAKTGTHTVHEPTWNDRAQAHWEGFQDIQRWKAPADGRKRTDNETAKAVMPGLAAADASKVLHLDPASDDDQRALRSRLAAIWQAHGVTASEMRNELFAGERRRFDRLFGVSDETLEVAAKLKEMQASERAALTDSSDRI